MKPLQTLTLLALFAVVPTPLQAVVTLDWAYVANPGNPNDSTGYGGVGYEYQIMKY